MEPAKRKKGRPPAQQAAEMPSPSLKLTNEADRLLSVQSKKLKTSKREYASAAVVYFAQSGLDPRKELPKGLANVSDKVGLETRAIRVQNVDIGNRLIAIIRAWEKTLYSFMQVQQGTTLSYLEQIEKNILAHQVAVETNLLSPLVEQVIQAGVEANMARILGERTHLRVMEDKVTPWVAMNEKLNGERDGKMIERIRKFITTNSVPVPKLSVKPGVPAAPAKAVANPAPGAVPPVTPAPGGTAPTK